MPVLRHGFPPSALENRVVFSWKISLVLEQSMSLGHTERSVRRQSPAAPSGPRSALVKEQGWAASPDSSRSTDDSTSLAFLPTHSDMPASVSGPVTVPCLSHSASAATRTVFAECGGGMWAQNSAREDCSVMRQC